MKQNNQRLQKLASLKSHKPVRVLFVCLGNICRSPAAQGVMEEIVKHKGTEGRWVIDSAGTGGWHVGQLPDKRMRLHGRERGYDFHHICRQVHESDFDNFDLIIGMDDSNISNLRSMAPTVEAESKIFPMAAFLSKMPVAGRGEFDCIPDPYYEGSEGFELVLDLLEDGCSNLYEALT